MTLLKDVRFLLIIGLAILCLMALKMCSDPNEGQVTAVNELKSEENASAEKVAEADAGSAAAVETTDADKTTVEAAQEATAKEVTETTAQTNVTEETTEAVAVASTAVESAVEEDAAKAEPAAETESAAQATETLETETAAADEGNTDTAVVSDSSSVVYQVEPIVIRDAAASGNFVPDLKTDISSVKNGMHQYGTKLEHIKALLNKLNPG